MVAALLVETMTPGVSWSPYYKVTTETKTDPQYGERVQISINGVPHQTMSSADWKLNRASVIYGAPYAHRDGGPLDDVLIIGAGSGSDVAITLEEGARHVDAVDIDPRLVQIGVQQNPDHAYQNPGVTRYINDGRAFLENTDKKYDLILFALPDSLALVSGASQIRLESFLFTEEALRSARDHLTDDGMFAMYNYYREDWLIDRLGGTAAAAFGHDPCIDLFSRSQRGRGGGQGSGQPGLQRGELRAARVVPRSRPRQRPVPVLRRRHDPRRSTCGRSAASW